jgi:mono/diheme cytochrome c family protein
LDEAIRNDAKGDGPAAARLSPQPANLRKIAGRHLDGDLAWKIINGQGAMPAWKNMLGENQLWDLVNYIQSLATRGEKGHKDRMEK